MRCRAAAPPARQGSSRDQSHARSTHDCTPVAGFSRQCRRQDTGHQRRSNGKFPAVVDLDVVDLDVGAGQVTGVRYELLPIFSALLPEDASVASEIATMRDHDRAMLDEKLPIPARYCS